MYKGTEPQEAIRRRPSFCPYMRVPNENMDIFYARYLADPARIKCFNGRRHYKIIDFWHFTARSENEMLVTVDSEIGTRINDFLLDENGNEYQIKGVAMARFRDGVPEWHLKVSSLLLTGDPFRLGEYLTHK